MKIRTTKTAHCAAWGTPGPKTRYVWICFHGYGQLVKYFIQRFQHLDPEIHYVLAPEGLNRFYFEGLQDRPVATWMTREDRLDEIADYVQYLHILRDKTGWERIPNCKIIYLGFSQGVTTMHRWMHNVKPKADYLLMWAGGLADDIFAKSSSSYFESIPSWYFIGDKDQYVTQNKIYESQPQFRSFGFNPSIIPYEGDHRIYSEVLDTWITENLQ